MVLRNRLLQLELLTMFSESFQYGELATLHVTWDGMHSDGVFF